MKHFLNTQDWSRADLDAAVEGALSAKMRNGGAACTAANRVAASASARRPC